LQKVKSATVSRVAKEKCELREKVTANLLAMERSTHFRASQMIGKRLMEVANDAQHILAFWPLSSEPDITDALEKLLGSGKTICLPYIDGNSIIPLAVKDLSTLVRSKIGVYTADPASAEEFAPGSLDLIIIPGLAFSTCGKRLGRGGGYYDRFLTGISSRIYKVAVAFDLQICSFIPIEPHDSSVHSIITESRIHAREQGIKPTSGH
jgi:5-formyltetrahydrofolate cyclo-ligase|tara:strand:+ start:133 stop:756 length:624 start_codon:yes stop_codon:yes gene_type:complete